MTHEMRSLNWGISMQSAASDIVFENIRNRRTFKVATLSPEPVERAVVERILEAATWAPSHGQTEPWRFVVFTGDARVELGRVFAETFKAVNEPIGKFTQAAYESQRDRVMMAPVWIGIGMQPAIKADGTRAMPEEEELAAVACAVQNLHLMTAACGLGGQWTSNPTATHPRVAEFLGITPPGKSMGFFALGHIRPDAPRPTGKRRPIEERVQWR